MHLFRQKRRDEKTGALVPAGPWYAEYREPTGRKVRVRLEGRDGRPLRDERVAKLAAAELTRRLELGSVGVERHTATRARRPLDLAEDYVKELARLGRAALHVSTTRTRLRRVLGDFSRVEDVTPETVRETLVRLSEAHGFGPKTQNYHRLALSAFFAWLIKEGRWGANPVASVPRAAEDEPETPRRALTAEELEALLAATPEPRATVYRVAATTGLRRAELRALRWVGLDLDAGTLTLPGRSTKNRREAVLPLPPGTVAALLRHKEDAEKGAEPKGDDEPEKGDAERKKPVFKSLPGKRTFDRDLVRAKLVRLTAEGKLVFHSLRSTFATSLARTGAPLTLTQKLMRHSTPTLTANVYTRLSLHDGRAAVAAIDLPFGDVPRGAGRGATARPTPRLPTPRAWREPCSRRRRPRPIRARFSRRRRRSSSKRARRRRRGASSDSERAGRSAESAHSAESRGRRAAQRTAGPRDAWRRAAVRVRLGHGGPHAPTHGGRREERRTKWRSATLHGRPRSLRSR